MNNTNQPTIISMEPPYVTEVAKQFVLCYYSMMHESPHQLHRFYQENSSMIYEDDPVFGQKNIHDKFMHVNLSNSDVRVHVLQLDALKAYDKIVIQVAGEISANSCEWRRFMQTFVLGEVSHNNFFVMTDIFRFQDRVFGDSINEEVASTPTLNKINDSAPQSVEKHATNQAKEIPFKNSRQPVPACQKKNDQGNHVEPQPLPVGHKVHHPAQNPVAEKKAIPNQPQAVTPVQEPQPHPVETQPPPPKSWAQMASNGVPYRPKASESIQHEINANEAPHPVHQRGSERINSGRGGMRHGKQNYSDKDNHEHHGSSRGSHIRGGGSRNSHRGGAPITASGSGRRN